MRSRARGFPAPSSGHSCVSLPRSQFRDRRHTGQPVNTPPLVRIPKNYKNQNGPINRSHPGASDRRFKPNGNNIIRVDFAFPTQTLHVAQLDPSAEHKPGNIPDTDAERRAVLEGRKLARELTQDQPWKHEMPGPVSFAEEFDSEW